MNRLNRLRMSPSYEAALTELLGAELRPSARRSTTPRIAALVILTALLAALVVLLLNR
jgi:hypothetical protein